MTSRKCGLGVPQPANKSRQTAHTGRFIAAPEPRSRRASDFAVFVKMETIQSGQRAVAGSFFAAHPPIRRRQSIAQFVRSTILVSVCADCGDDLYSASRHFEGQCDYVLKPCWPNRASIRGLTARGPQTSTLCQFYSGTLGTNWNCIQLNSGGRLDLKRIPAAVNRQGRQTEN